MDQHVTPEISVDEVRASLREYFRDWPGIDEVRRNRDDENVAAGAGFDRDGWSVLAEQVGLTGIAAPETWGGLGLPTSHLVAAVEECGATLYPGPARASVLLAAALHGIVPDDVPTELRSVIGDFLSGATVAGVSTIVGESGAEFRDGRVTGRLGAVTHGAVADIVLSTVTTVDGPAIALIAPAARPTRVERISVPTVDLSTPLADVVVSDVPAVLLTSGGDNAAATAHRTLDALLLAAEQVGGAQGCLAGMVDYATVREQFGKVIGTYQAIQHRCAQTAVATVAARALVAAAADAVDRGDAVSAEQLTLLARADAGDGFAAAASSLIQVSGGIGFTWEHDAHLFFRRSRATAAIGGTPARLRDRAVASGCVDLLVHAVA
ncbi:acyl-CoA dehydrogenase family protein [Gordonia sp. CPCC 206044]|uniref:acyl-CoA dehydrogenase family protein n=1 Tax=Gordonia sp. CPCC 206044 TaxID=3140793 RepID=UPI003AF34A63